VGKFRACDIKDLREFCRYLKDRSKAIKDAKRKLAIEQFNGFIQDKLNAVQRVEQLKKRNEELKQKQKQKNIQTMDLKKKQQQIATKYLISNLDWE
jgi:uncharacterized protein (DUF3084 family)